MEFIGLFKCHFCTSSLHDLESLITHFSLKHLNKELFECESCCIKFWKIPDYYEHRKNSSPKCSGKYGITMKSFFNTIKLFFETTSHEIEKFSSEKYNENEPITTKNCIKSEIINEEITSDKSFSQNLSKIFNGSEIFNNLKESEIKVKPDVESDVVDYEVESSNLQPNTGNISSHSPEDDTYKVRNLNSKNVKRKFKKKAKRNKYFGEETIESGIKEYVKVKIIDVQTNLRSQNLNNVKNGFKKCDICGKCFNNFDDLRNHLQNHGTPENIIQFCHICGKVFHKFNNLVNHISNKHPEHLFCIKCDKEFSNQENFKSHMNKFHKIQKNRKREVKKLECFECIGKSFTRISTFVMHLSNQHKKSDEEIKQILEVNNETFKNELMCKICGKLLSTIGHFIKHQHKKHGVDGSKRHKCKSCPTFFATQAEVTTHTIESHRNKLSCQICNTGKIYACIESLTAHMRKYHNLNETGENNDDNSSKKSTKVYKFICGQCGKIMYGRTQFKNHEASNCGKNPVHKCPKCGKGFASAGTLKGHISIHEDYNSYQYVCDFCQKRYRSKHQLEKHRRIHTGERPFQCPHCERAFGTSAALFVHITTHTGVKRYMCTCGERFSCITGLKGHWKTNITTCGSDPNRSTKPVGQYIGYRKGKIVNIRPEEEMMMRPSL